MATRTNSYKATKLVLAVLTTALLLAQPARPVELTSLSGLAHGYPAFRDANGKMLAEGEFMQWVQDDRLHVKLTYKFKNGERIEENAVFQQQPELVQQEWSWRESKGGQIIREFGVNFASKTAKAQKREKNELKQWEETIAVEPGKSFAGFGFTLALQNLRKRLLNGERIELKAVGFRPQPQVVTVQLSHAGVDRMEMSGRSLKGDHFVIHPELPAIAKLFVRVPDTHVWLTNPAPAGFLRWEGPVAEPNDQIVRVDLLSGEGSGLAQPMKDNDFQ
ncbi:MAG: hypothetical protein QOC70_131 [Verrucomicrobiota bacterium]|jgi:hypothetical protein